MVRGVSIGKHTALRIHVVYDTLRNDDILLHEKLQRSSGSVLTSTLSRSRRSCSSKYRISRPDSRHHLSNTSGYPSYDDTPYPSAYPAPKASIFHSHRVTQQTSKVFETQPGEAMPVRLPQQDTRGTRTNNKAESPS